MKSLKIEFSCHFEIKSGVTEQKTFKYEFFWAPKKNKAYNNINHKMKQQINFTFST